MKTNKKRMRKFIIIMLMIAVIIITYISFNKDKIFVVSLEDSTAKALELTAEDLEVGEKGYISSLAFEENGIKTGTAPFDNDDTPGNDSGEGNNIVRTYDQVTWTVEATMNIKQEYQASTTELFGGILHVKAVLPAECLGKVEWDLESMAWQEKQERFQKMV